TGREATRKSGRPYFKAAVFCVIAGLAAKTMPADWEKSRDSAKTYPWSERMQLVLDTAKPLDYPRGGRLPLYLWPAMDPGDLSAADAERLVMESERRGVGIVCSWTPGEREACLKRSLAIARAQKKLGTPVNIDATRLLYSFFDGDIRTAHVDASGNAFFDESFGKGHKMGCPFTLDLKKDGIRERVEWYVSAYKKEGIDVDFIWADWEIDGPIEFNRAHEASKKCVRCREKIPGIDNFLAFQKSLRDIRSDLQRYCYASPVLEAFPRALVGNYAVYPHDGYRYWYDYFEEYEEGQPFIAEQNAKYRLWHNDFPGTGYTFAMPVVYPWARLFGWYDFDIPDYRWFYNMLRVASNAAKNTPACVPIISFVHWHMIDAEKYKASAPVPFSEKMYRELLWHMLLRGTDAFYMWCGAAEYADEVRILHEVWAAAQKYGEFLDKGVPVAFDAPKRPGTVVSALRLGNRVLVRRTDFAGGKDAVTLNVGGKTMDIPPIPETCRVYVVR
ncbi:MAG TPA: hypothetical protein PLX50_07310, partial [Candidatus Aminicenantes bacterium]|nr:hypothetical protein [Candidatus Aminicenantes bacterium]